ncbi:hypothetical protein CKM354_000018200 [Cercospora kikuchii]|uniref:Uncharacterized protein n=1 Tax=Cercospora kikuchii TaxID=84275 RepID=A0A9P3C3E9_9PEZI|nr:uncharacterized protein CKM354_000018200 [Cercospora kikuchii]GIZ36714.1 hypothetical protein CKM354_000018200 [Cercospora kikuchii]
MIYPPSPALSACDSLDGIDDLDAFLAAQGRLSHFPTPPTKNQPRVEVVELPPDDDDEALEDSLVCTDPIANAFAREAAIETNPSARDADAIHFILVRADLPLEVVATAFNMISALRMSSSSSSLAGYSPDLLTVAALSLVVSYTDDHAPLPAWYSRYVCRHAHSPQRINSTALEVLAALDWHIHTFTTQEAYGRALTAFCSSTVIEPAYEPEHDVDLDHPAHGLDVAPLKLVTSHTSIARFEHGNITPDDTPPCSARDDALVHPQFLRLL